MSAGATRPDGKSRLEGPGSAARLRALKAGFRAANPQNKPLAMAQNYIGLILAGVAVVALIYWLF